MSRDEPIDLNRLIEERRDEKRNVLKEKLKAKLKIIRDRRVSGVNPEPFPEGAFDRLKCNYIWEKVLGYQTDSFEITNAYYTCETLAEILEERLQLLLLPKALQLVKINADDDTSLISLDEWKSTCLDARLVSKAWKEIAEFQLFNSEFAKEDWFLNADVLELRGPRSNPCVFENATSVSQATSLFGRSNEACSFIRNMHVSYSGQSRQSSFCRNVNEFMQINGRSVSFFVFQMDGSGHHNEAYEWFLEIIEMLPNLKGLKVSDSFSPVATPEAVANFQNLLHQRQFPVLDNLEYVRFTSIMNRNLLPQIFRNCVNLKSVMFHETQPIFPEMNEPLRRLTLESCVALPPIIMTRQFTWPLKHLTIKLRKGICVNASELFPGINRFQETLQSLHIWGTIRMDADATNVFLHLPHLKVFHYFNALGMGYYHGTLLGFDNLLPLKDLEDVIMWSVDEYFNPKVKVRSHLTNGEMDKSNVWKCFPYLMRFQTRTKKFSRPISS